MAKQDPYRSLIIVLTPSLAACFASAAGPERREVSADGHQIVRLDDQPASVAMPGPAGLFAAVPDWQNALRRQVGGLQVADMNGDGWSDVVVGCYISSSFPPYLEWRNLIYYNIGGTLETEPSWVSDDAVSTGDVQVADFNGDGFPDIFSANGGFPMDSSLIYFGSASGPSTTAGWTSAEPQSAWNNYALPVDIDGDGDLDVVTANQGNSQQDSFRPMFVFENHDGVLETVPSWASTEQSLQGFLAAGDVDGDGRVDIAVSKWVNFETGIYLNSPGGLLPTPWWTTGDDDDDKGVALADFDGNGDVDLVVGHDPTRMYANDGGALSLAWSATGPYFGASDLRALDIDGDGDIDLAETHFSNGHVNIYLNDGGLPAAPDWTFDSSAVGTAIAFGDINGDGRLDLVVGNSGDVSVMVFLQLAPPCPADVDGSGDIGFSDLLAVLGTWGPCPGCPADINGDGVVGFDDLIDVLAAWGPC